LAGILVFTFVSTSIVTPGQFAYAAPVEPLSQLLNREAFKLPAELGKVSEIIPVPGAKNLIIHIEEAHANYSAQTNIRDILHLLRKQYGIKQIFSEGAGYELHPEALDISSGNAEVRKTVNDRLMRAGELTGAEAFLMEPESGMKGYGVEEASAYREDLDAYRDVYQHRNTSSEFLSAIYGEWQKQAGRQMGKDLREFLLNETAYGDGKLSLQDWLNTLKIAAAKHLTSQIRSTEYSVKTKQKTRTPYFVPVDLTDARAQVEYPVLVRYFRLRELDGKIDLQKVEAEKTEFLKDIQVRLNAQRTTHNEIVERRTLSVAREVEQIFESAKKHDLPVYKTRFVFERLLDVLPKAFSFDAYPNLRLYIQQIILLSELQSDRLNGEIELLSRKITGVLATTEPEKRLIGVLDAHRLVKKTFALELSREEFASVREQKLSPEGLVQGLGLTPKNSSPITVLFGTAVHFYEKAIDREDIMLKNSLARLASGKEPRAVLVTGGFHSEGLKEKIVASGVSYIGITPQISEVGPEDQKSYLNALLGGDAVAKSQIEPLLRSELRFSSEVLGNDGAAALRSRFFTVARSARPVPVGHEVTTKLILSSRTESQTGAGVRSEARARQLGEEPMGADWEVVSKEKGVTRELDLTDEAERQAVVMTVLRQIDWLDGFLAPGSKDKGRRQFRNWLGEARKALAVGDYDDAHFALVQVRDRTESMGSSREWNDVFGNDIAGKSGEAVLGTSFYPEFREGAIRAMEAAGMLNEATGRSEKGDLSAVNALSVGRQRQPAGDSQISEIPSNAVKGRAELRDVNPEKATENGVSGTAFRRILKIFSPVFYATFLSKRFFGETITPGVLIAHILRAPNPFVYTVNLIWTAVLLRLEGMTFEYHFMKKRFYQMVRETEAAVPEAFYLDLFKEVQSQQEWPADFQRANDAIVRLKEEDVANVVAKGAASQKARLKVLLLNQAKHYFTTVQGFGPAIADPSQSKPEDITDAEEEHNAMLFASIQGADSLLFLGETDVIEALEQLAHQGRLAHQKSLAYEQSLKEIQKLKDVKKSEEATALQNVADGNYEAIRRWTDMEAELLKVVAELGQTLDPQSGDFQAANRLLITFLLDYEAEGESFYWIRKQAAAWLAFFDSNATSEALERAGNTRLPEGQRPKASTMFLAANLEAANPNTMTIHLEVGESLICIYRRRAFKAIRDDAAAFCDSDEFEQLRYGHARIAGYKDALASPEVSQKNRMILLRRLAEIKNPKFVFGANELLNDLEEMVAGETIGFEIFDSPDQQKLVSGPENAPVREAALKAYKHIAMVAHERLKVNSILQEQLEVEISAVNSAKNFREFAVLAEHIHVVMGNLHRFKDMPNFEEGAKFLNMRRKIIIQSGGSGGSVFSGMADLFTTDRARLDISGTDDGGGTTLSRGFPATAHRINSAAFGDIARNIVEAAVREKVPGALVISQLMGKRFGEGTGTFVDELGKLYGDLDQRANAIGQGDAFRRVYRRVMEIAEVVDKMGIPTEHNSVQNLVGDGIRYMTEGHGEDFMNPDGIYAALTEFARLVGCEALAVLDTPYGNIMKVTSWDGQVKIGQSFASHTPSGPQYGRQRRISRMKDVSLFYPEISCRSRIKDGVLHAELILAGLSSLGTSLGVLYKNRVVVKAMKASKALKVYFANVVGDDETRGMNWAECVFNFLRQMAGCPIQELFNVIIANKNNELDVPVETARPERGTKWDVHNGSFGGYTEPLTPTRDDLRRVRRMGLKIDAEHNFTTILMKPRRDDPLKWIPQVAAVVEGSTPVLWDQMGAAGIQKKFRPKPIVLLMQKSGELEALLKSVGLNWQSLGMESAHDLFFHPDLQQAFFEWVAGGKVPAWVEAKRPDEDWFQSIFRNAIQIVLPGHEVPLSHIRIGRDIRLRTAHARYTYDDDHTMNATIEVQFLSQAQTEATFHGSRVAIAHNPQALMEEEIQRLGKLDYSQFKSNGVIKILLPNELLGVGRLPQEKIDHLAAVLKFNLAKIDLIWSSGFQQYEEKRIQDEHELQFQYLKGLGDNLVLQKKRMEKGEGSINQADDKYLKALGAASIAVPYLRFLRRTKQDGHAAIVDSDMDMTISGAGTPLNPQMSFDFTGYAAEPWITKQIVTGQDFLGPLNQVVKPLELTERQRDWVAHLSGVPRPVRGTARFFKYLNLLVSAGNAVIRFDENRGGYTKRKQNGIVEKDADLCELAARLTMPEVGYKPDNGFQIEFREAEMIWDQKTRTWKPASFASMAIFPTGRDDQKRDFDPQPYAVIRKTHIHKLELLLEKPQMMLEQLAAFIKLGPDQKWILKIPDTVDGVAIEREVEVLDYQKQFILTLWERNKESWEEHPGEVKRILGSGQAGGATTIDYSAHGKAYGIRFSSTEEDLQDMPAVRGKKVRHAMLGDEMSVTYVEDPEAERNHGFRFTANDLLKPFTQNPLEISAIVQNRPDPIKEKLGVRAFVGEHMIHPVLQRLAAKRYSGGAEAETTPEDVAAELNATLGSRMQREIYQIFWDNIEMRYSLDEKTQRSLEKALADTGPMGQSELERMHRRLYEAALPDHIRKTAMIRAKGNDYSVAEDPPEEMDLLIHTGAWGSGQELLDNVTLGFDPRGTEPYVTDGVLANAGRATTQGPSLEALRLLPPEVTDERFKRLGATGFEDLTEAQAFELLQRPGDLPSREASQHTGDASKPRPGSGQLGSSGRGFPSSTARFEMVRRFWKLASLPLSLAAWGRQAFSEMRAELSAEMGFPEAFAKGERVLGAVSGPAGISSALMREDSSLFVTRSETRSRQPANVSAPAATVSTPPTKSLLRADLDELTSDFNISTDQMEDMRERISDAAEDGLEAHAQPVDVHTSPNFLSMSLANVGRPNGDHRGVFWGISFDEGAVCLQKVTLKGNHKLVAQELKKIEVGRRPEGMKIGKLLDQMAEAIAVMAEQEPSTVMIPLGVSIPFPLSLPPGSGAVDGAAISNATKEWKGSFKRDVKTELMARLKKRKIRNVEILDVVNNSTALLAKAAYTTRGSAVDASLILDEGVNVALYLTPQQIPKISGEGGWEGEIIVVSEIGDFQEFPSGVLTRYDKELHRSTTVKTNHIFEKLTSMTYLPKLFGHILKAKSGIGVLPPLESTTGKKVDTLTFQELAEIYNDASPDFQALSRIFPQIARWTPEQKQYVRTIAQLVIERSARILAAGIVALVEKLEAGQRKPPQDGKWTFAIGRELFDMIPAYRKKLLAKAIEEIYPDSAGKIEFIKLPSRDSAAGAAVVAAMVKNVDTAPVRQSPPADDISDERISRVKEILDRNSLEYDTPEARRLDGTEERLDFLFRRFPMVKSVETFLRKRIHWLRERINEACVSVGIHLLGLSLIAVFIVHLFYNPITEWMSKYFKNKAQGLRDWVGDPEMLKEQIRKAKESQGSRRSKGALIYGYLKGWYLQIDRDFKQMDENAGKPLSDSSAIVKGPKEQLSLDIGEAFEEALKFEELLRPKGDKEMQPKNVDIFHKVVGLLDSKDPHVVVANLNTLARISKYVGETEAFQLRQKLYLIIQDTQKDEMVRSAAAETLGCFPAFENLAVGKKLLDMDDQDASKWLKSYVAGMLAATVEKCKIRRTNFNDPEEFDGLVGRLLEIAKPPSGDLRSNITLRANAIRTLAAFRWPGPDVLKGLKAVFRRHNLDATLQRESFAALAQLYVSTPSAIRRSGDFYEMIRNYFTDPKLKNRDAVMVKCAYEVLREMKRYAPNQALKEQIKDLLEPEPQPRVKSRLVFIPIDPFIPKEPGKIGRSQEADPVFDWVKIFQDGKAAAVLSGRFGGSRYKGEEDSSLSLREELARQTVDALMNGQPVRIPARKRTHMDSKNGVKHLVVPVPGKPVIILGRKADQVLFRKHFPDMVVKDAPKDLPPKRDKDRYDRALRKALGDIVDENTVLVIEPEQAAAVLEREWEPTRRKHNAVAPAQYQIPDTIGNFTPEGPFLQTGVYDAVAMHDEQKPMDPNPPAAIRPNFVFGTNPTQRMALVNINGNVWHWLVAGDAQLPRESLLVPEPDFPLTLADPKANYDVLSYYRRSGLKGYINSWGLGTLPRLHVHIVSDMPIYHLPMRSLGVKVDGFEAQELEGYGGTTVVFEGGDDKKLAGVKAKFARKLLKEKVPHEAFEEAGKVIFVLWDNNPAKWQAVEKKHLKGHYVTAQLMGGIKGYPRDILDQITPEIYHNEILKPLALPVDRRDAMLASLRSESRGRAAFNEIAEYAPALARLEAGNRRWRGFSRDGMPSGMAGFSSALMTGLKPRSETRTFKGGETISGTPKAAADSEDFLNPESYAAKNAPELSRFTVVSRQLEAGLDRALLAKVRGLRTVRKIFGKTIAGLVAMLMVTGGLGVLMHDLFPSWQKNFGEPRNRMDAFAVNVIYDRIKGQEYAEDVPEEVRNGQKTLGDYLREVLAEDKSLRLSVFLEAGSDFRGRADEWIGRTGDPLYDQRLRQAREAVDREIKVKVYPTQTAVAGMPNFLVEAFYIADDGSKVQIFDEVYPDAPHEAPNLWRDLQMGVYRKITELLTLKLQEQGRAKQDILFVDNEVFVSLPTPLLPDALHHHMNHSVYTPTIYWPDASSLELLGYSKPLGRYIIRNGKISIPDAIGITFDLITGVALYEHTPAVTGGVVPGYVDVVDSYNEDGLRSTNGVLIEQWQAPLLRKLIDLYKKKLGMGHETEDKVFFDALNDPKLEAILGEFQERMDVIKAYLAGEVMLWLKTSKFRPAWFDEAMRAYQEEFGLASVDGEQVLEAFRNSLEAAMEKEETWARFFNDPKTQTLYWEFLKNPIVSNVRRQVDYKGPQKWKELLLKLQADPVRLEWYKKNAPRVILGGREFGPAAHKLFLEIQNLIRVLKLEDRFATIENYNIDVAPIIFQGDAATMMLTYEFIEASATSNMKGLPNGAILMGSWGGSQPELFTIVEVDTGREVNIFKEKVTYEQMVENLKSNKWKITNGLLVLYSQEGDGRFILNTMGPDGKIRTVNARFPDAESMIENLGILWTQYQDSKTRRTLQWEALRSSPLVDMEKSQARAHIKLWQRIIQKKNKQKALFSKTGLSSENALKFLSPRVGDEAGFIWRNDTTDNLVTASAGVLAFVESIRWVRTRGADGYHAVAYHALRGDIFKRIFHHLSGYEKEVPDLYQEMLRLEAEAQATPDLLSKVRINMTALRLLDRFVVSLSGNVLQGYASGDKTYEPLFENDLFRQNLSFYLHTNGKPFGSLNKNQVGFGVQLGDEKYIVALNEGESKYPGVGGNEAKAWGQLYGEKAFQWLTGLADPESPVTFQVINAVTDEVYGDGEDRKPYPFWMLTRGALPVGLPSPGIQILKLRATGEMAPEEKRVQMGSLILEDLRALVSGNPGEQLRQQKPRTYWLKQTISDLQKNRPEELKARLRTVSGIGREKAIAVFGVEGVRPVMAFIAGLVPELLEDMKDWESPEEKDREVYEALKGVIQNSELKDLFERGEVSFANVSRDTAVGIIRTLRKKSGGGESVRNVVIPIHFAKTPYNMEEGKVWFGIGSIASLGLLPRKIYRVKDWILGTVYEKEHTRESLSKGGWWVGISVVKREDPAGIPQPGWRFQVLQMQPVVSDARPAIPRRTELRTRDVAAAMGASTQVVALRRTEMRRERLTLTSVGKRNGMHTVQAEIFSPKPLKIEDLEVTLWYARLENWGQDWGAATRNQGMHFVAEKNVGTGYVYSFETELSLDPGKHEFAVTSRNGASLGLRQRNSENMRFDVSGTATPWEARLFSNPDAEAGLEKHGAEAAIDFSLKTDPATLREQLLSTNRFPFLASTKLVPQFTIYPFKQDKGHEGWSKHIFLVELMAESGETIKLVLKKSKGNEAIREEIKGMRALQGGPVSILLDEFENPENPERHYLLEVFYEGNTAHRLHIAAAERMLSPNIFLTREIRKNIIKRYLEIALRTGGRVPREFKNLSNVVVSPDGSEQTVVDVGHEWLNIWGEEKAEKDASVFLAGVLTRYGLPFEGEDSGFIFEAFVEVLGEKQAIDWIENVYNFNSQMSGNLLRARLSAWGLNPSHGFPDIFHNVLTTSQTAVEGERLIPKEIVAKIMRSTGAFLQRKGRLGSGHESRIFLKEQLDRLNAAGRTALVGTDMDDTFLKFGAPVTEKEINVLIAVTEAGGHIALDTLADKAWSYKRFLGPLFQKLHDEGKLYLLKNIHLIADRVLGNHKVGKEIFVYDENVGAYTRIFVTEENITKAEALVVLRNYLRRTLHEWAPEIVAYYGDSHDQYDNDGSAIGNPDIPVVINVGGNLRIPDALAQHFINTNRAGPSATLQDFQWIGEQLSKKSPRGLLREAVAVQEEPRPIQRVFNAQKNGFQAEPGAWVSLRFMDPERHDSAPVGFVWAGTDEGTGRWNMAGQYLIPILAKGRIFAAMIPPGVNVLNVFWTGRKADHDQKLPGHWERRDGADFKIARGRSEIRTPEGESEAVKRSVSGPVDTTTTFKGFSRSEGRFLDVKPVEATYEEFNKAYAEMGGGSEKAMRRVTVEIMNFIAPLLANTLNAAEVVIGKVLSPEQAAKALELVKKMRFATALKMLGVKTVQEGDVFMLSRELALGQGFLAAIKDVLPGAPVAVITPNKKDLEDFNRGLPEDEKVLTTTDSVADIIETMRLLKAKAKVKTDRFQLQVLLYGGEILAAGIPDDVVRRITQQMLQNFLRVAGQSISDRVNQMAEQFQAIEKAA